MAAGLDDLESRGIEVFLPAPLLPPLAAMDWLAERVRRGAPTSVVRLGDGEFAILGLGREAPIEHTEHALGVWLGHFRPDQACLARFADELREAVRQSDLIGVPRASRQRQDVYCQYVAPIFHHYRLLREGQVFTDCGLHHFMQIALAFEDMIRGLPFVGLVGCRDLGSALCRVFDIAGYRFYPVPAEGGDRANPAVIGRPHFPDRYLELLEILEVPFPGAVFLVGAGAFGKVYCQRIKSLGGIAIDIGSLMDAWANVASRKRIARLPEFFSLDSYAMPRTQAQRMERYQDFLENYGFLCTITPEERAFLASRGP
jgi:hypothetical protein